MSKLPTLSISSPFCLQDLIPVRFFQASVYSYVSILVFSFNSNLHNTLEISKRLVWSQNAGQVSLLNWGQSPWIMKSDAILPFGGGQHPFWLSHIAPGHYHPYIRIKNTVSKCKVHTCINVWVVGNTYVGDPVEEIEVRWWWRRKHDKTL